MYRSFGGFFYPINTTAGLAILTSLSYFYAGLSKKGFVIIFIVYNYIYVSATLILRMLDL
jgi:F0F1-type ATP synthase membrane subunit a